MDEEDTEVNSEDENERERKKRRCKKKNNNNYNSDLFKEHHLEIIYRVVLLSLFVCIFKC